MDNNRDTLSELLQKYLSNRMTPDEFREFWRLLEETSDEAPLDEELKKLWQASKSEQVLIPADTWDKGMQQAKEKLTQKTENKPVLRRTTGRFRRFYLAAAAVLLLVIVSSVFLLTNRKKDNTVAKNTPGLQKQDRLPGGDRAVLTLSDGSLIVLDSAGNGVLAQQGNTKIIKKGDGQLIYNTSGNSADEVTYNLLQTPRGGQYAITLPDGSKVWLNAASTLKYPVAFAKNERRVEITGEAYFEIARDISRPFRVQIGHMEAEVLGTHFNINGYADETDIKTTLLEGSVKINTANASNIIKPGQQAQVKSSGNIKIATDVDLEEVVAWKDGNFQFENSDINSVMRQIARWYDLDVSYKGTVSKHFIGSISRNVKLSQVLSMLQQTGEVKFFLEGKKITVMP